MTTDNESPDFLCHYYEASRGPLRSLSDLPAEEAEEVLDHIRSDGQIFASKRSADYLQIRRELEQRVRKLFIDKGGHPLRQHPQYFILGESAWLKSWYQDGCELRIPLNCFAADSVSFTYGDTFPAMRYGDGKPYRRQVFTLAELPLVVQTYGLPQVWNPQGLLGPDRYIEAQVWTDIPLLPFLQTQV